MKFISVVKKQNGCRIPYIASDRTLCEMKTGGPRQVIKKNLPPQISLNTKYPEARADTESATILAPGSPGLIGRAGRYMSRGMSSGRPQKL